MNSSSKLIKKYRELFTLAADVKDTELNKSLQEADILDIRPELGGASFFTVPATLGGGAGDPDFPVSSESNRDFSITVTVGGKECQIVPLYTIICYYAYIRYMRAADQKSTTSGLKLQTFNGSIIVPDTSKNKRWEEERGKADAFMEAFRKAYDAEFNPPSECKTKSKNFRFAILK